MSAIDPLLDRSHNLAGTRLEGRELAMLRHDIRGALMGVMGAVGQMESAALNAEARQQVERLSAASRTLAGLVSTMLGDELDPDDPDSDARIETDGFLVHLRRRYAAEAAERGLRFVVEAGADVPPGLRTHRLALGRIIDNLVGNAIKFSDAGTVGMTLSRDPDGSIVFRVTDDGPGIAADGGAALSDRAGQGLGLEIVHMLADRIGAEATIANRPGGGAVAALRLRPEVADARAPAPAAAPYSDLTGLRVLLAEDNPTNQMVASQMLRSLNAEVTLCSDGIEALERFETEIVDLVVVDIEMPRLSGLDVIRAIRARGDDRAQVPIVALTAYAMREHRERIAAAGANGLISKPITSVESLGRGLAAHVAPLRAAPQAPQEISDDEAGPVIDHAVYNALCEAIGAETMSELLDKVIVDLLSAQRELVAALEGPDGARIRTASHILISVAGAVGAVRLQTCARDLNVLAHTDARDRTEAATRRCVGEIDAAVAFARARRAAG